MDMVSVSSFPKLVSGYWFLDGARKTLFNYGGVSFPVLKDASYMISQNFNGVNIGAAWSMKKVTNAFCVLWRTPLSIDSMFNFANSLGDISGRIGALDSAGDRQWVIDGRIGALSFEKTVAQTTRSDIAAFEEVASVLQGKGWLVSGVVDVDGYEIWTNPNAPVQAQLF